MEEENKKRPYEAAIPEAMGTSTGPGAERNASSSRSHIMNSGDDHFSAKCDALAEYCEKNNALPPRYETPSLLTLRHVSHVSSPPIPF